MRYIQDLCSFIQYLKWELFPAWGDVSVVMATDEDVAGWMKQVWALPKLEPSLTCGFELSSGAELCCSHCGRWEKGWVALGAELEEVFSASTQSPLFSPIFCWCHKAEQGSAGDGCWQVWLFLSLVVQASSASSILPFHKCHKCHLCQLSLVCLPSSQCMCGCAYTHMGSTWEHLFSTFPELHCALLQLEDVNKWLVCIDPMWILLCASLQLLKSSVTPRSWRSGLASCFYCFSVFEQL